MNEENNSAMMDMYHSTLRDIKEGEIVKGKVVDITNKDVVVDVGFKSEGFVSLEEFRKSGEPNIDDQVDVLIESIEDDDGKVVLSFEKAEKAKGWQKISDSINEGDLVEGRVIKPVKGGFIVDVFGVDAFLPMSLSSFKGLPTNEIMTSLYKFQIAKMNAQRKNLILSRRDVVQKEREKAKAKLWEQLEKRSKD